MLQEAPTEISLSRLWRVVKGLGKDFISIFAGAEVHPFYSFGAGAASVSAGFSTRLRTRGLEEVSNG